MNVLIYSHAFAPAVGGVETFVKLLAEGLSSRPGRNGSVTVVTQTPASGDEP